MPRLRRRCRMDGIVKRVAVAVLLLVLVGGASLAAWNFLASDDDGAGRGAVVPLRSDPSAPHLKLPDPDASNQVWMGHLDALAAAYTRSREGARPSYEIRRATETGFIKALMLTELADGMNSREEVKVRAARHLGHIAPLVGAEDRPYFEHGIRRAIEVNSRMHRVVASSDLIKSLFSALARYGSEESLRWMLKNFTHSIMRWRRELRAAHAAILLFEDTPGRLRLEVVNTFVRTYTPSEAWADPSSARADAAQRRQFWEYVGPGALKVVNQYATSPGAERPREFKSLRDVVEWLRGHRDPGRDPWIDPER